MTDEAMNVAADAALITDVGAVASTGDSVQPIAESVPEKSSISDGKPVSARDAITRAFERMNAGEQGDKPADGMQPHGDRARNPDGTFKAGGKQADPATDANVETKPGAEAQKTPTVLSEAPARFSADAKAVWATAPEAVRAEATRAIRELEGGIEQYRAAFEPYKDFDRQLKTNGQTFKEVFDHYTGIESLLAENPLKGLDTICRNMGYSLEQIAKHVVGQPVDETARQNDAYVNELKAEIADLRKQVGGVTTTIRSQQEKALLDTVESFWTDPAHPRAEELAEDIVFFINSGRTKDLKEAYALAERLNPAPAPAPQIAAPAAPQTTTAQPRKGLLSPSGAPASGSDPVMRKAPASAREAIERSFASLGL